MSLQTIHDNNAYTLRRDQDKLKAKINIVTAYLLKEKIPSIVKFTNNIFALGLSIYQRLVDPDTNIFPLIEKYFEGLTAIEKIEVNLRTFYYRYIK